MSRKGRSKTTSHRDTIDISSDSELVREFIKKNTFSKPAPALHLPPPKFNLKQQEDRRAFHPDGKQRPRVDALPRSAARLKVAPPPLGKAPARLPSRLAFTAPARVTLCVRRAQRREVLFALGKGKKGIHTKKRLTPWSSIKC